MMSSFRVLLPGLTLLAACPAPPSPERPTGTAASRALPADAGAAGPREVATLPPADAAPVADNTAPGPERVPAGDGCLPEGDPRIGKLEAEAAAWTRSSFEAALRRRGLEAAKISGAPQTIHRGVGGYGHTPHPAPAGTVVQATIGGASGRFIAGESYWTGSGRAPAAWELVKNDRGEIFRLRRRPQPSAKSKRVIVCGCTQRRCGPYGSGCPACGLTVQSMYGPLPAGATFNGDLELRYPSADLSIERAGGQCPVQRRCPPPPP